MSEEVNEGDGVKEGMRRGTCPQKSGRTRRLFVGFCFDYFDNRPG